MAGHLIKLRVLRAVRAVAVLVVAHQLPMAARELLILAVVVVAQVAGLPFQAVVAEVQASL